MYKYGRYFSFTYINRIFSVKNNTKNKNLESGQSPECDIKELLENKKRHRNQL